MGQSGFKGKIYWVDDACPVSDCVTWGAPDTSNATCWYDEITRFVIDDSVLKREYGHDKSQGWQDVVAGTRRLGITIDAVARPITTVITQPRRSGRVAYLELFPYGEYGSCNTPLQGWAMVDRVTHTISQQDGAPVTYTMTLSSKGPWVGVSPSEGDWGGFECNCQT